MKTDRERKAIWGWTMYDWANSAFATTIMGAVLPIFYSDVAAQGLEKATATAYWGYTQSIAMFIVAILAPILGAISDFSRSKMQFLKFFAYMGMIASSLLIFISTGDYLLCSFLFILGSIGYSGANVFYDAFLPEIAAKEEMDYISTKGYAFGYLGGGLLLLVNILMIMKPGLFGIPNSLWGTRLSFLTVGIWWFIFSIPLFKNVIEDRKNASTPNGSYLMIGFKRVRSTIIEISKYRDLTKFLIAFWLYNDGIGTIIKMASIYGYEIGINKNHLIGALLLTQFIGIPFSLLFGKIAKPLGPKKALYIALGIYTIITILGWQMSSPIHFWILAVMVGFVQGGAQALSRSIYSSMIPKGKSAEFFGFMGISSKFASIFGPFIFGLVSQLTGASRNGIFALVAFFIVGMVILSTVDIEKGRKAANQSNADQLCS